MKPLHPGGGELPGATDQSKAWWTQHSLFAAQLAGLGVCLVIGRLDLGGNAMGLALIWLLVMDDVLWEHGARLRQGEIDVWEFCRVLALRLLVWLASSVALILIGASPVF